MAVPKLRFPEFTDDWEQRKFGDVFEEYSEKNHEDLPPLTIVQGSGTIPREESGRDIKYDKSSLNNYKLVNPGDFILHLRSFEGGLEVANSQGIVSPAYHIFRGIRTDSRFYYPFFRSHDFINILLKPHVYGIRDGKSIDVEGMKSIKIPYPDFDEQKRIGDFFDHLDNAITLHQRKLDDIKLLKKSMLQKMFPAEGRDVPEVRFPGFTAAWEQRKLGDIASSFAYGLNAAAKEFDGKHKYLRITDIDDVSRVFQDDNLTSPDADIDAADDYRLEEGDLLFARTGASVGKSYIYKESDGLVYYAGFLIRAKIRPEYDAEFVFQNTLTSTYEKYIKTTSQRSGQPGVNAKEYAEYSMSLPEYAEQVKIGMFLRKIDDAITLHQRKCDDLQKLKKALLQQMFC